MEKMPVGFQPGEEQTIDNYVNEISKTYFGKSYTPKIKPIYKDLPKGVGGVTTAECSRYGCKPKEIAINRKAQELYNGLHKIPLLHEKTHEAQMQNLPYLSMVWDEPLIEGMTIYTNIKTLKKNKDSKLADLYYKTLSPKYREYYHLIDYIEKKKGVQIGELARYYNKVGEVISKNCPGCLAPKGSGKYN